MSNNTPSTLSEMISLLESVQTDYDKFYDNGNASAGTRIRKAMQQVKATAQEVRVHVQETKNTK
ncbi:histone H1 [bacterium]|nr:histone H1 [bacterium]